MKSLYERLGGQLAVEAAIEVFYGKVMADPLLQPMFAGVDLKRLMGHQIRFFTYVFGGPNTYTGRSLGQAHQRLVRESGLGDAHFDAVGGHLKATLEQLGVPPEQVQEVLDLAGSVRDDVLGRTAA
jgi:hemoglobin